MNNSRATEGKIRVVMKKKRKLYRPQYVKASRWILECLDGNVKVYELARCLEMHRSTLFKILKDKIGLSPKDFICKIKIEAIRSSFEEMKEIVPKVLPEKFGYASYPSFHRAFKRITGMTIWKFIKIYRKHLQLDT